MFDHPASGREVAKHLLVLQQGNPSAAGYAIQFRTIAAESGWNKEALMTCFLHGLSETLQDELAPRDPPRDLESLFN